MKSAHVAHAVGRAGMAAGVSLALAGCLVLPMNRIAGDSRANVSEKTATDFVPGVTTREDVLLKLGEPDEVSPDEQRLGYRWSRIRLFWIVVAGGPYSAGFVGGDVEHAGLLELVFDADGRLVKTEVQQHWTHDLSAAP